MSEVDVIAQLEAREVLNPLRLEMNEASARVTLGQAEILRGIGVPAVALIAQNMVGVTIAEIDRRDYWVPCDTGKSMVVTPLEEGGQIVDLIAFEIGAPDVWYLRTGAGWALGAAHIDEIWRNLGWAETQQWIDLHSTPLDWLRASGTGACVTQWTNEARQALRMHQQVRVTSNKFARALRLELTRPPRIPEIELKGSQSRAA